MYAIVEIAGQQFKVEKDQKIFVHRLAEKEGSSVTFDKVLLIDDGKKVNVGTPVVLGAAVQAKVLAHLRGDKVLVFKKKRRKGYKKLNGHRQDLTQIEIEGISLNGKTTGKKTEKKEPVKKEVKKEETEKTEVKKEKKEPAKTPKAEAKPDKLTKIEGIGPKIAGILTEAGIDTFKKLSETKAEKISEILVAAGGNSYNRFDPTTWPEQAKLAAGGKWDELKELQDKLNGGKA